MMKMINPNRHIGPEAGEALLQLWEQGYSQAEMHRRLSKKFPEFDDERGRKRIQRIVKEDLTPKEPDRSGTWTFSATSVDVNDPSAARHVLEVTAYLIEQSENRLRRVTNAEAAWIIRLRSAYPEMPPEEVWRLTRRYLIHELREESSQDLDHFLGFEGWTAEGDARYTLTKVGAPTALYRRLSKIPEWLNSLPVEVAERAKARAASGEGWPSQDDINQWLKEVDTKESADA